MGKDTRHHLAGTLAVAVLVGCSPAPKGPPIPVGVVLPLPITNSRDQDNLLGSAVLAAEQINAAGGVLGRDVVLMIRDDASNSGTGVAVANELVTDAGVVVLIGSLSSPSTLAIAQQVTV